MLPINRLVVFAISFTLVTITYSNCSQVPTGGLYSTSSYCQEGQAAQNCIGNLYEVGFDSGQLQAFNLGAGNVITGYTGNCYDGGYPVAKVEYYLYQTVPPGDYQWKGVSDCIGGQFIINSSPLPNNFSYGESNHLLLRILVYESTDAKIPINKLPSSRNEAVVPIISTGP